MLTNSTFNYHMQSVIFHPHLLWLPVESCCLDIPKTATVPIPLILAPPSHTRVPWQDKLLLFTQVKGAAHDAWQLCADAAGVQDVDYGGLSITAKSFPTQMPTWHCLKLLWCAKATRATEAAQLPASALKLYHIFAELLRTALSNTTGVIFHYTGSEAGLSGIPHILT